MQLIEKNKYVLCSLLLHGLLLLICVFYYLKEDQVKKELPEMIVSYIYSEIKKSESKPIDKINHVSESPHLSHKIAMTNEVTKPIEVNHAETHRLLLRLLHEAIAEKGSYPESAMMLNQSGSVTLQFVLYPTGEIRDVVIIKSSGVESLDQAALSAIQTLSFFPKAALYLQSKETFLIDIVF